MTIYVRVTNMKCGQCAETVRKTIAGVPGVQSAEVSLEEKKAVVTGDVDASAIKDAVEKAGYTVE